jgi:hypothetical protein
MKKILTPPVKEDSVYYSDFTGKCFGSLEPAVVLTLQFGYGSKWDGNSITLHLTDEDIGPILQAIQNNLTPESRKHIILPL